MINEDLRKWVAEKWVDIGAPKKGGGFKPCGRSKGEKRKGYPKCVPSAKASAMSKGQRKSAVQRKRAAGNTGPKPTNVPTLTRKNESMNCYERIFILLEGIYSDEKDKNMLSATDPFSRSGVLFNKTNPKAGTEIMFNTDQVAGKGLFTGIVKRDDKKSVRDKAALIARQARLGHLILKKLTGKLIPHPLTGHPKNFVTPENAKRILRRSAERN